MNEAVELPIVIVSGLPRSGTSLMMQMLQRGGISLLTDGIRPADEDNPRGYFELEAVKRTKQDAAWLDQAAGMAVKVIYRLLYDLPTDRRYQVILMRRPMAEVLASQSAMLSRTGSEGASIPAARLGQLFSSQLADAVRYLRQQPQFDVLEVNHRDVLDDPLVAAKSVAQFLRRPLDLQAMASAVDTSLYRRQSE